MTQALRGERVTVYDRNGEGWAWGQLADDGYVGWIPEAALTAPGGALQRRCAAKTGRARNFANLHFPGRMGIILYEKGIIFILVGGTFILSKLVTRLG